MSKNWTDEELEASVRCYLEMKDKELKGIKFSKVDYYRKLSRKFERSEKSIEYRMQNISFVFSHLGRGLLRAFTSNPETILWKKRVNEWLKNSRACLILAS